MDSNTVRILSIHGGGGRGYVPNRFLQKFLQQWGISGSDLWKYFDVICGTSIGGILACALAYGKSPDELETFFLEKAKKLFTTSELVDSTRPTTLEKLAWIITSTPFYKSSNSSSTIGHNVLQNTLVEMFGTDTLSQLKTKVVIPSFEKDLSRYVIFSNYNDPLFKGYDEQIVNVARATSAAPIYLPSHSFNGHEYIDGGIYANDPAEVAINLGKIIKPNANRICVLDVGTGLGGSGFDGNESLTSTNLVIEELFKLLNVAMLGSQEMVNFNLKLRSQRTLEQFYYYRFQPVFPANFEQELDNSKASWFTELSNIVDSKYASDSNDISTFLGHLTA